MRTFPVGVKARIFGADSEFLNALRHHPRFQNKINVETGIAVSDCDMIVCTYKHQGLLDICCLQLVEVKSRNACPDFAQESIYRTLNGFKGKKPGVIFYGASFVSYSGATIDSSDCFRWGRFNTSGKIFWRTVLREDVFDLVTMLKHPDTLTNRVLFKSHHGSVKIEMETKTQLGFTTRAVIEKRY